MNILINKELKALLLQTPYSLIPQSHWNHVSRIAVPLDVADWVESMKDFEL